jgi:hypothetical protein
MTSDPLPSHLVRLCQAIECFPQITVEDRVSIAFQPTICFPAWQVLEHSALDVLRVGNYGHRTRFFEFSEALDCGFQLHSVVSGIRMMPTILPFVVPKTEQTGPAARTGIAASRPVNHHHYFFGPR